MAVTDPWLPRAADEITQTLTPTYTLSATTATGEPLTDLELAEGSTLTVTFDEGWSPHVQLAATCPLLDDMHILDPRAGVRIRLSLGYRYPGGQVDEHLVADLALNEWADTAVADRFDLSAHSDEMLLEEWDSLGGTVIYAAGQQVVDVIAAELYRTLAVTPLVTAARDTAITEDIIVSTGTSRWDLMKSLADTADVWLYCDGLRVWHIAERPSTLGQPVAQLATGPGGTVTARQTAMSRQAWGNAVLVEYAGGQFGWAAQTTGPMGTETVGVNAVRVRYGAPWPGQSRANAAAAAILARALTRGDSQSLTALAAWWVRPGHTVTDTAAERVLVARVTHSFPDALMTIHTRKA